MAVLAGQVLDIAERLRLGLVQAQAPALVFGQQFAAPEKVDVTILAVDLADRLLEGRQ
ncbi:MAG: hypothetical protein BWY57_03197 [Betaproteobacteria bacterium ADurb.Bin341]|nr:MAG: hypothetical protein BWY57_03197 [Betaproteobacteria bacterium ADurb.Bin341]